MKLKSDLRQKETEVVRAEERSPLPETRSKLADDEKPEPHLPRTQQHNKRVKSALRNYNLNLLDKDANSECRSSLGFSRHNKLRSSMKDRPNHFLSQKGYDLHLPLSRINQNS